MSRPACSGIFFVVRLPDGWQLCSMRFAEYGLITFIDAWPDLCGTLLGLWISFIRETSPPDAAARFATIYKALPLFIESNDAFPRGWVGDSAETGRVEIHHGGDLTRSLRVSRREIEVSFNITGRARWIACPALASVPGKAEFFRRVLAPDQDWVAAARRRR